MSINYVEKTAILYALLPLLYFASGFLIGEGNYIPAGVVIIVLSVTEYIGIKMWYKTLVEGLKNKGM